MRFATRTFLWFFVPLALLLTASFWTIQTLVVSTVRDGIRSSLRETHESIARVHSRGELQNSRFLRVVGESAALKAGLELLLADPKGRDARLTVEDQLREICDNLRFDFLLVSTLEGGPLAGVMRIGDQLVALDSERMLPAQKGFLTIGERTYQVTSVPIDQGEERVGILTVGERFDFSEFSTPAVLTRHGKVMLSSIPGMMPREVESALAGCREQAECEIRLRNETYLSLPMQSLYFGDGYLLRSLQSVDSAGGPLQLILRRVFILAGVGALLAGLVLGALSSRSVVKPIAGVVTHLRESEQTGVLPEFRNNPSPILEIRELTDSFNRAATAIREGHEGLHRAYVEFVGSLASALDARDGYTAGHSRRVSDLSCAIAKAMRLSAEDVDEIRVGSLLHDIGKIGITDNVLQKPGRLTAEEMAIIQQHPTIGRKILEGVHGFQAYLPTVELHHENWDGTGYPRGLRGEATPLAARIVHVGDAYDAMTSDRPYRRGMTHEETIRELQKAAGTQFDPSIVETFVSLFRGGAPRDSNVTVEADPLSVHNLAEALNHHGTQALAPVLERKES